MLREAQIAWHGVKLNQPDWSPGSHSLAVTIGSLDSPQPLFFIFNAYWEPQFFDLPPLPDGRGGSETRPYWRRLVDTAFPSPEDIREPAQAPLVMATNYLVKARSVVVLIG